MNVIILAAGQGRRMRSGIPKVLHPLGGSSLLGHVLATARALEPRTLIVVYGHGGESVPQAFPGAAVHWVHQSPQLGTGHAVMQAAPALEDGVPTLILYGDVPLLQVDTLRRLGAGAGAGLGLLTVTLEDPAGYGRIVREVGRVVRIVEDRDASEAERLIPEVNTGVMVIPTPRLKGWLGELRRDNAQGEYYLTDIVALAVRDSVPIHTSQPAQVWETLGVNSKAQLAHLERILQGHLAGALMEAGVTLRDPARLDVRGRLECGQDVSIDIDCLFEGEVRLAEGVSIGPHCLLRDVTVGPRTRIEAFSHIDGASIGSDCRIGPYARLRPQTALADAVHVGNFVEVKASSIGVGSKANHLTYIGDSSVGSNVNVGAGTITCNYDGVNKHRTIIEDDVFIGSDTQLVAPVRVGRGATLGAGTTLTRDAPAGKLTVSRARQASLDGWTRPKRTPKGP